VKRTLIVLAAGALFGVGLVISGMADPRNVIGFLNFTGDWRPQLAAVMAGAVGVHAATLWYLSRRTNRDTGVADCATDTIGAGPGPLTIDRRLLLGSAIFGVGWGLSGYCPGPAFVSLGLGADVAFAFVAAMIAGMLIADRLAPDRSAKLR
jgi:uncharacterized membrane protein YedE/YeeE